MLYANAAVKVKGGLTNNIVAWVL